MDEVSLRNCLSNNVEKNISDMLMNYPIKYITPNIINIFFEYGADPKYNTHYGTFLHAIFMWKYKLKIDFIDILKCFLKHGVDVNIINIKGECCITTYILNTKIDSESYDEFVEIINLILSAGYNLQKITNCVNFVLDSKMLEFLLQHGFTPNVEWKGNGYYLQRWYLSNNIDLLLKYGYDVNCGPHDYIVMQKFIWTFRLRRNLPYYTYDPLYRQYSAGELDFRNPRLQSDLKDISRTLLCIFKYYKITRYIAYICLRINFARLV
jgi:hypothetical protein